MPTSLDTIWKWTKNNTIITAKYSMFYVIKAEVDILLVDFQEILTKSIITDISETNNAKK